MYTINCIHACLSVDEKGEEGIIAFQLPNGTWMPLISSDRVRLDQIVQMAEMVKAKTGVDYKVVKFVERVDVSEQYKPHEQKH